VEAEDVERLLAGAVLGSFAVALVLVCLQDRVRTEYKTAALGLSWFCGMVLAALVVA
jgi:hypothetical protein